MQCDNSEEFAGIAEKSFSIELIYVNHVALRGSKLALTMQTSYNFCLT